MLIHGSKSTLSRRRIGLTVQYCPTNVKIRESPELGIFTEDFRKPILVSGKEKHGSLMHYFSAPPRQS